MTKRRSPTLSDSQRRERVILHVQRRAYERIGVVITKREIIALSEKCADGAFGAPGNVTRFGREHYGTEIRGHSVRLIYCPNLGLVTTLYQRPIGCKRGDRFSRDAAIAADATGGSRT